MPSADKNFAVFWKIMDGKFDRTCGSHRLYIQAGNPVILSVPVHDNTSLKKGLQRHLMKAAGIEEDMAE
ncbi:MAG: type II toxin-antitoxin system HicA family toxin [Nitrospira sp.]|nr:type II toxin-antitoxin system HicA family toxin [Nitrospira sp.]